MGKVITWLLKTVVSLLVIIAIGVGYLLVAVDPNDFKPEIKSAAASQGLELSLDGNLSWQFLPQIGVVVEQVEFAHSTVASGKISELSLSVSWAELFNIDLSSNRLPVGSIEVGDATILLAELAPNTFPIQLKRLNAKVNNFSLTGEGFSLEASAQVFSGLALDLDATLALQVDTNSGVINEVIVSELEASIDSMEITGQFNARNNFATAQGSLRSNRFDLQQLVRTVGMSFPLVKLPMMASKDALTAVSWNSSFNTDMNGLSTFNTQLELDNQVINIASKVDHRIHNLYMRVSGDQFDMSHYLAADSNSSEQNGALFAPLAVPFALWLGRSQMELSLSKLKLSDFDADNIYINLFGNQKVLRLSSFNSDIFGGQVNATGRLDMRSSTPSFNLQTSLSNIDLQLALAAMADSSDISGLLSLEATIQSAGNNRDAIIQELRGGGEIIILDPAYAAINAEEMFCNAAALLGSGDSRNSWSKGTQFETLTGNYQLADGKLQFSDMKTATGNIAIAARGSIKLAQQRYNLIADTRVNGASTSASGCSVNKQLQNRSLPFVCSGSFEQDGTTSCKPDENLIRDLLKDSVYEQLGEKLFNTPATTDGDKGQQSDPLKSLLKGIFENNLR
ncbi:AsmA family protein [SAR92 clade bacterium H455]|uniref:AsmA family protein n=1 Tax=SAR92 clade bacterium H455 TaxID=2974818 RepID=A0ABY5TLP8_9GAMM|nr:AsmA family protein [SAR92 clade bacterium H455]